VFDSIQVISSWQKPIKLISRFLALHGRPSNDHEGGEAWVLDAGCGSGTASIAAILLGMNAYAFDMDESCVKGTKARLGQWTEHGLESDHTVTEEARSPQPAKGRKRKADSDGDPLAKSPQTRASAKKGKQVQQEKLTDAEMEAMMRDILEQDKDEVVDVSAELAGRGAAAKTGADEVEQGQSGAGDDGQVNNDQV
jgi:SAM-dependent methyltransferase